MAAKNPKQTNMATQSAEEAEKEHADKMAARTYVGDPNDWDRMDGMEYGGQSEIMELEVGEVTQNLTYLGFQPMTMEGGKMVTVHIAKDEQNSSFRLPIAASFLRSADQAGLQKGDVFIVKRFEDTQKKRGIGKGQDMKIFALKITKRTNPTAAAA
jgi:hypothetical protein